MDYKFFFGALMFFIQHASPILINRPKCKNSSGYVIRCAVLMLLFLTTVTVEAAPKRTRNGDYVYCHNGAITPREPFFLLGSPIILNCTSKWPSSHLTFEYGTESREVHPQYIHTINETTIMMTLPEVTEDTIKEYRASMSYRCMDKQDPKNITCISNTHVKVDYYPVAPVNFQCRILGFNTMDCSWDLAVEYRHDIKVKCQYAEMLTDSSAKIISDIGEFKKCPNPDKSTNGCFWDEDHFYDADIYIIAISVTNRKLNITVNGGNQTCGETPCFIFGKYDIAEPLPVKNLKLDFAHGSFDEPRCGRLKWWPPSNHTTHDLIFSITVTSDCDSPKLYETVLKKMLEDPKLVVRNIFDLNPYTMYNISVKARYLDNQTEKGYWSQPSSILIRTPSAVPKVSPNEASLVYEIQNKENALIYWKPLTLCELYSLPEKAVYHISVSGQDFNVTSKDFRTKVDISTNKSTMVSIETVNDVGRSKQAAILNIPQESERPMPSELIIQSDPSTPNCQKVSATIDRHETVTENVSHKLVVCRESDHCEHELEIVDLPRGVRKHEFPSDHCYGNYRYGLVTRSLQDNGRFLDTGIDWARCKYQLGKVPDKLQEVNVSESLQGLMVHWKPQDCLRDNHAYVAGYTVKYCTWSTDCECKPIERRNISAELASYTLQGLQEGTPVCVWVYAQGLTGPGPETLATPKAYVIQGSKASLPLSVSIILASVGLALIIAAIFGVRKCIFPKLKDWYKKKKKIDIPEIMLLTYPESTPLTSYDGTQSSSSSRPIDGYQRTDQLSIMVGTGDFTGSDTNGTVSANQMESQCTETTGLLSTGRYSEGVRMDSIEDPIHVKSELAEDEHCKDNERSSQNVIENETEPFSLNVSHSETDTQRQNPSNDTDICDHSTSDSCSGDSAGADRDTADDINSFSSQEGSSSTSVDLTVANSGSSSCNAVGYKDVSQMSASNFEDISEDDSGSADGYKTTYSDQNLSQVSSVDSPSSGAPCYMKAGLKKNGLTLPNKMAQKRDFQLKELSEMPM